MKNKFLKNISKKAKNIFSQNQNHDFDVAIKSQKCLKINSKKIKQKKYFEKLLDEDTYCLLDGNDKERYIFEVINSALRLSDEIEFEKNVLDA